MIYKRLFVLLAVGLIEFPSYAQTERAVQLGTRNVSRRIHLNPSSRASHTAIHIKSTHTTKGFLHPSGGQSQSTSRSDGNCIRRTVSTLNRVSHSISAFNSRSRLAAATAAVIEFPRGGGGESLQITGNALVKIIVNTAEKISPVLASIFRMVFKIIEKITGLDLLPVKVERKATKLGKKPTRKRKSQKVEERNDIDDDEEEEKVKAAKLKKKKTASKAKRKGGGSAAAKQHLTSNLKTTSPNYRIQRELKQFLSSPPPNLKVSVGKNIRIWVITFNMPEDTIYAGEKYRLRVQFPSDYPTQPPSVFFLQPTPRHEHVYTNGDICLSLLGKDWRPTMTAQSLAVSIMSILSGARKKSLPMDNARQAMNKPGGKQDDWIYHDDNC